jgi:hypothetical protein
MGDAPSPGPLPLVGIVRGPPAEVAAGLAGTLGSLRALLHASAPPAL